MGDRVRVVFYQRVRAYGRDFVLPTLERSQTKRTEIDRDIAKKIDSSRTKVYNSAFTLYRPKRGTDGLRQYSC